MMKSNSKIIFLHKDNKYSKKKINRKKKKGFTLMEVIIVMLVIGIMASILLPKFTNYINEAKKLKVIEQSRKVIMAVESYNIKATDKISMNNDVSYAKSTAGVSKYFENMDEEVNKLSESMTMQECYDIVKGVDFVIDADTGVYKNIGNTTSTQSSGSSS